MRTRTIAVVAIAAAAAVAAAAAAASMYGDLGTGGEPVQDVAGGDVVDSSGSIAGGDVVDSSGSIAGGDVAGGDVAGGDVAGGDVAGGDVAGGDVAGGDVAGGDVAGDDHLVVLASFYPVYEFTKAVGGDRADVSVLVPGGIEPHDWEPSFSDIQRMQVADVVVVNGIGFESWIEDFEATNPEALVVDASEGIEGIIRIDREDDHGDEDDHDDHARDDDHGDEDDHARDDDHGDEDDHDDHARDDDHGDEDDHDDHARDDDHGDEDDHDDHARDDDHGDEDDHARDDDHGDEDDHARDDDHGDEDDHGHDDHGHAELKNDPHVWLNPLMVKQQVANIADGLSQKDPQNEDYYRSNAAAYAAELDDLDREIRERLAGCATDFITFHNAFSYFAAEYGLTQHAMVDTIDPHGAPTAQRIRELVDLAGQLGMDVVFFEEGSDDRTARTIASELGQGGSIMPIATLELSPPGGPSYTEKMRSNLDGLAAALCR